MLNFLKRIKNRPKQYSFMNEDPAYQGYDIGDFTYGSPAISVWDKTSTLRIGKFCSINRNSRIFLGGDHYIHHVSTYPFSKVIQNGALSHADFCTSKGDVIIENDVWVGSGALILSGVHIGNGAVIGADAVIAKDVAPYSIIVGNPGTEKRKRFTENQIEKLLKIRWWDWDMKKIEENLPLFMTSDIDKFIDTFY